MAAPIARRASSSRSGDSCLRSRLTISPLSPPSLLSMLSGASSSMGRPSAAPTRVAAFLADGADAVGRGAGALGPGAGFHEGDAALAELDRELAVEGFDERAGEV